MAIAFDNIVFDLDSTLTMIEGIDQLAVLKNAQQAIVPLTEKAMSGILSLEEVFKQRLDIIKPTLDDLLYLGDLYKKNITPGAKELIAIIKSQKKNVFVITGGYDLAAQVVCEQLGIDRHNLFANRLLFTKEGTFHSLDETIQLWKNNGKNSVIADLKKKFGGSWVMIGDGMSDFEASQETDKFIYFGGVVFRDKVAQKTNSVVKEKNLLSLLPHLESRDH